MNLDYVPALASNHSDTPTLNPNLSHLIVGRFGFSIYGFLFFVTLYRLLSHFCLGPSGWTLRKAFHAVLLVYTVLETLSYIPMAFLGDESYQPWAFVLHMIAISFDLTAFSLVTVKWTKTIDEKRGLRRMFPVVVFLDICFFLYSCYVCVNLLYETRMSDDHDGNNDNDGDDGCSDDEEDSLDKWAKQYSSYKYLVLFEPIVLTFNAIFVILFGAKTIHKIVSMQLWNEFPLSMKCRILTQTFFTMYMCAFCYMLRSICLIALFISIHTHSEIIDTTALWWFGAIWCPTLIPSSLLLYAMRNLDKSTPKIPTAMENMPVYHMENAPRWSSFSRSVFGGPNASGSYDGSDGDGGSPKFGVPNGTPNSTLNDSLLTPQTQAQGGNNNSNNNNTSRGGYDFSRENGNRTNSITF